MTDKVRWIYNDETDELDRVSPHFPQRVDFGKPNGARVVRLIGWITLFVCWIIYKEVI